MQRKAQITLFIIFTITVIVLLSVYYFSIKNKIERQTTDVATEIDTSAMTTHVEKCLIKIAEPGIYLLGKKGGYIYSFDETLNTEKWQVAYYTTNKKITRPTRVFMEQELARLIAQELPECVGIFSNDAYTILIDKNTITNNANTFPYNENGITIIHNPPIVTVSIQNLSIQIKVDYPITLITSKSERTITHFSTTLQSRLGYFYSVTMPLLMLTTRQIDLEQIAKIDAEITILPLDKENTIYTLTDKKLSSNGNPFIFTVATKQNHNNPPLLDFIPDFIIPAGKHFEYQVTAIDPDDDPIFYTSSNPQILIDTTGMITIFAETIGEKISEICVYDIYHKETQQKNSQNCETITVVTTNE